MHSNYLSLSYSFGVGVVLVNAVGLVGVGQRSPDCARVDTLGSWQMPQAALASGEPVRDAAQRLLEDAGIRDATLLAEAPGWFTFELPPDLLGVALQGRYLGQKLKWVAAKCTDEPAAYCAQQRSRAFTSWRWVTAAEAVAVAPPLKREVYDDVLSTFAPVIANARLQQHAQARTSSAPWFVNLLR